MVAGGGKSRGPTGITSRTIGSIRVRQVYSRGSFLENFFNFFRNFDPPFPEKKVRNGSSDANCNFRERSQQRPPESGLDRHRSLRALPSAREKLTTPQNYSIRT